jgi:glyoxylase-like metal-dependent hydrolase (beta-lactamase superfamily II)
MSESKFLPLPPSVLPLPEGPEGDRLQRAGERGYVVISGFVQTAFVVTGEGVLLVDAPPALDGKIQAAIASVTDKQVTHFIYTHSHLDHVGAVTKFPGARRIAHEEAARLLANHDDPARPLPDQVIDGPLTVLRIGDEEVQLIYPGPNHEAGNILVHFPAQKLSVMTDVVMPGWAPYRGWGNADYPPGMLAAHDAILATDFDTYVGGHVYRTGTRADVKQSRDFLLDTIHTTQKAMGNISYADAATGTAVRRFTMKITIIGAGKNGPLGLHSDGTATFASGMWCWPACMSRSRRLPCTTGRGKDTLTTCRSGMRKICKDAGATWYSSLISSVVMSASAMR